MRRYLTLVGAVVFLASCSLLMIQGGAQVCPCPENATECVFWCPLKPCDHDDGGEGDGMKRLGRISQRRQLAWLVLRLRTRN